MVVGCSYNSVERKTRNNDDNSKNEVINQAKITIDGNEYKFYLEDNETAESFADLLPQEFNMNELNGNEKYTYLDDILPTKSYSPGHIYAGDVMLYGNNCLVIFYKSFDTIYKYTKIGHIDGLPDLGNSSVSITIEK